MKNKLILMMGGQGSGKGTLSKAFLAEHDNQYNYIETGAMLRALPEKHPLKAIIARGEFVPDTEVFTLLKSKIDSAGGDILLDGFPRKVSQAEWLVSTFSDRFDIVAVYLNLPESLMLKRIENRIREGGGRADDADSAAVRRRLDNFQHETMPAIKWLKGNEKVVFVEVAVADAPVEVNYTALIDALKSNKII